MLKKHKKRHISKSPSETMRLGRVLAKEILERGHRRKALVLALVGDLGGGKTTFIQGLARGLGIKGKILSPTFVIIKRFKIKDLRFKFLDFYHIDCYRIKGSKEILDLGFKEIISNPRNIVAIEWAERIGRILPKDAITLNFDFIDEKTRKITISGNHSFISDNHKFMLK